LDVLIGALTKSKSRSKSEELDLRMFPTSKKPFREVFILRSSRSGSEFPKGIQMG
jgi:hypothetical protein